MVCSGRILLSLAVILEADPGFGQGIGSSGVDQTSKLNNLSESLRLWRLWREKLGKRDLQGSE